jgi:hypothetical protein
MLAYEMALVAKRQNLDRWLANELLRIPGRIGIFAAPDIQSLKKDLEAEIKSRSGEVREIEVSEGSHIGVAY